MSLDLTSSCIACGNQVSQIPVVNIKQFTLFSCSNCQSLVNLPRPHEQDQIQLHNTTDYFDHPYFEKRRQANQSTARCRKIYHQIPISQRQGGFRHLDVGCDTGELVLAAKKLYDVIPYGVDTSVKAIHQAIQQGVHAFCGPIEQAPTDFNDFSLITAMDIIEHVVNPTSFLQAIYNRLQKNGFVYLETPNVRSTIYQLANTLSKLTNGKPEWLCERMFPKEHIQYFSEKGLRQLAEKIGFKILFIKKKTLPFSDIGSSSLIRLGVSFLQGIDICLNRRILYRCLLTK